MIIKIIISKLAIWLARKMNWDISYAGRIAETLDGDILKKLSTRVKKDIIFILGTTGKTTTKKLLVEIFNKEGFRAKGNSHSGDPYYGLIASMIERISLFQKKKLDYLVLEIWDLETLSLLDRLNPGYILITNLFKEQLSRKSSHEDKTESLKEYLSNKSESTLILNGDDPLVSAIGEAVPNRKFYYGIDNSHIEEEEVEDVICPICGGRLQYTYRNYGQLGEYACRDCVFSKPAIDYMATNVSLKNGIYFDLLAKGEEYPFDLPSQGFYNIYNILASLALLEELDIGIEAGELYLEKVELEDVELDTFYIRKPVFYNTADSQTLFNQNLETIAEEEGIIDIFFIFNDQYDEQEVTFVYESPLEVLANENIRKIYISGDRAYDLALALRYKGVSLSKLIVDQNIDQILNMAIGGKAEKLYIVNKDYGERNLGKKLLILEKKWSLKK